MKNKYRIIAFYLPQFHPIPENDKWWGKGFTEWTNVGKAKPLFPGHKQPKVPTELGYYDLRLKETLLAQVDLAKEAGVEGFCWWHYYFGDGKQLLEKPLQMFLDDISIDFPFCLAWANESWEKKLWSDNDRGNTLLIEQKYGGASDYVRHFDLVKRAFMDSRYMKVDGKPIFSIYKPGNMPNCAEFISCWKKLSMEQLGTDIHFVAHVDMKANNPDLCLRMGFDAVYSNRVLVGAKGRQNNLRRVIKYSLCKILGLPRIVDYKDIVAAAPCEKDKCECVYPGILCGWDHSPRSGKNAYVINNFSISIFKKHVNSILDLVKDKSYEHRIIFLKSWNEWGEGNFMEPDMEFGKGKIEALRSCVFGKEE